MESKRDHWQLVLQCYKIVKIKWIQNHSVLRAQIIGWSHSAKRRRKKKNNLMKKNLPHCSIAIINKMNPSLYLVKPVLKLLLHWRKYLPKLDWGSVFLSALITEDDGFSSSSLSYNKKPVKWRRKNRKRI